MSVSSEFAFTTAGHAQCQVLGPLGGGTVHALVAALGPPDPQRMVDIGCGKGAILLQALARWGGTGEGIDRNPHFLAAAATQAAAMGLGERVAWHRMDALEWAAAAGSVDTVFCMGTAPWGDQTVARLQSMVGRGGTIVLADGYWQRPPAEEYLALLGAPEDLYVDQGQTLARWTAAGLHHRWSHASSLDEWDAYEAAYARGIRDHVAAQPDSTSASQMLARIERWQDGYRRWGRGTLGYLTAVLGA